MMTTQFRAMNSNISLVGVEVEHATIIHQMIADFEEVASRFLPDNELAFLNNSPLHVPVRVHPILYDLLKKTLDYARKLEYYVHPFLGNQMKAIGYHDSFEVKYELAYVPESVPPVIFQPEPMEIIGKQWIVKKAPMTMDFGGFGKGYIVDCATNFLVKNQTKPSIVNAGGDLRAIGEHVIGIEHPYDLEKNMVNLTINNAAVATSGKNIKKWKSKGKDIHHLLNGQTGEVADNDVIQASVIGHSALEAEVLSKLFCILPIEKAKALAHKHFPHIAYFLYRKDHQLVIGGNRKAYRQMEVAPV